jgi:S-adenosylmethionine decarboxylase
LIKIPNLGWYLFTKVKNGSPTDKIDQTFEVLMSGLDLDCVKEFYQSENLLGSEATRRTGIDKIIPGSKIDSFQFEPCGYSANGLIDGYYWTMHVTPGNYFELNIYIISPHDY